MLSNSAHDLGSSIQVSNGSEYKTSWKPLKQVLSLVTCIEMRTRIPKKAKNTVANYA